jgi:hypothetical protein
VRPREGEAAFSWADAAERGLEAWPIHYLVPGGAALRFEAR